MMPPTQLMTCAATCPYAGGLGETGDLETVRQQYEEAHDVSLAFMLLVYLERLPHSIPTSRPTLRHMNATMSSLG